MWKLWIFVVKPVFAKDLKISEKLEIPIIASHEVYYLDKEMFEAHDALMCIGEKTYVNDTNRIKLTNQHYLKSSVEMIEVFKDLPEALENNCTLINQANDHTIEWKYMKMQD